MRLPCPASDMNLHFKPRPKSEKLVVKKGEDVLVEIEESDGQDMIHELKYAGMSLVGILSGPYCHTEKRLFRFKAEVVGVTTLTLYVASKTLLWPTSMTVDVLVQPSASDP